MKYFLSLSIFSAFVFNFVVIPLNVNAQKSNNYVVVVNENSSFAPEAKKFAKAKQGTIVTYKNKFSEVISKLKKIKPKYLALFAEPKKLTPDFIDTIGKDLTKLDDDPYFDVSYGIITSRNVSKLEQYVKRLLAHKPDPKVKYFGIGMVNDMLNYNFGIDSEGVCLVNGTGIINVCPQDRAVSLKKVKNGITDANVLWIGAHGNPSSIALDGQDQIIGSTDGLKYRESNGKTHSLPHQSTLTFAESCLTGRINGKPSVINSDLLETDIEGDIDTSLVLSFLESGTLNYIAATRVVLAGSGPDGEIIQDSFLNGVSIGDALKMQKNKTILNIENFKVSLPGSPAKNPNDPRNKFTEKYLRMNSNNWVLFGDPSAIISHKKYTFNPSWPKNLMRFYDYIPCLLDYSEKKTLEKGGLLKKQVTAKINWENHGYISRVEDGMVGIGGGAGCVLTTNLDGGSLIDFKITSTSGVFERYEGNAAVFHSDLGDEVMISVPDYVQARIPNSNSLAVKHKLKDAGYPQINDLSDITLTYEVTIDPNNNSKSSIPSIQKNIEEKIEKPQETEEKKENNLKDTENVFSDVKNNSLEAKATDYLSKKNIINGRSDGKFYGNQPVNRSEIVKFLLLANNISLSDYKDLAGQFPDVKKGAWYEKYVLKASKYGIINGYNDGTYKPEKTVNTAEFLKMLGKTFRLEDQFETKFIDVDETDWFARYAGYSLDFKLFPERDQKYLEPERLLTRKEVAIALYQFFSERNSL